MKNTAVDPAATYSATWGNLYVPVDSLFQSLKQLPRTIISHELLEERAGQANLQLHAVPDVAVNAKLVNPLANLQSLY